ncbi:squalene/phytoene synthase family protein [Candidatus Pelagibacter sp.]|nr:squalene/phytoene synthase family protein [Candidatus Pelagibacter sp.]
MPYQNYLSNYAKSFNWAGFFLSKETYQKCSALYDFCRIVDNIADDDNPIDYKINEFKKFENNFNTKNFEDPVIKNMWKLIDEFNISLKIVHDLFIGINSDIKESVKLNTKKDLLIYSYRVAGTVGLMMAKILEVKKKNSLRSAIDLGIAMQLTNISRDVTEDLNNGRSYIDESFEEIKSTIKLADNFYENSFYSIKDIPLRFRFSILVARRIYRKIGYKILNKRNLENYKKSGKIYVSNFEKVLETILSFFDLIRLFLINKNNDNIQHNHFLINEEIDLNERI